MRRVGRLVFVASTAVPAMAFAQAAPPGAEPEPVSFDLSSVPDADNAAAPGAPIGRPCQADATLPGDDPGIIVCVQRERSYASVSKVYDEGGWAEPPLPPADPTTLSPGSCVDFGCLPPAAVNGFSVLDGLYKIGKKIIEGE